MSAIVSAAVDLVLGIFPFIGVFFILAGAVKLVMAYRQDNPEAQSGAAKDLVIGAAFIVFKLLSGPLMNLVESMI
jgi:hypothetical protein